MSERVYVPAEGLEPHEIALAITAMSEAEFSDLSQDMRQNGQAFPVTLLDGKVLDGRHRVRALAKAGEPVWVVEYDGDDPVAFAASANLHRRSLGPEQRSISAARLANFKFGDNQHTLGEGGSIDPPSAVSQSRAAELMNVSVPSVKRAKRVIETAPEVAAVVERGGMSLNLATKVAALPEPQRAEILAKEDKGEMRRALALVAPPAHPADAAHKNTGRTRLLTPPQPVGVTGSHQFGLMAWNQIERMANDDPETVRALKTLMDKCAKKLEVAQSITGAIA